jgi:hypothetical protein
VTRLWASMLLDSISSVTHFTSCGPRGLFRLACQTFRSTSSVCLQQTVLRSGALLLVSHLHLLHYFSVHLLIFSSFCSFGSSAPTQFLTSRTADYWRQPSVAIDSDRQVSHDSSARVAEDTMTLHAQTVENHSPNSPSVNPPLESDMQNMSHYTSNSGQPAIAPSNPAQQLPNSSNDIQQIRDGPASLSGEQGHAREETERMSPQDLPATQPSADSQHTLKRGPEPSSPDGPPQKRAKTIEEEEDRASSDTGVTQAPPQVNIEGPRINDDTSSRPRTFISDGMRAMMQPDPSAPTPQWRIDLLGSASGPVIIEFLKKHHPEALQDEGVLDKFLPPTLLDHLQNRLGENGLLTSLRTLHLAKHEKAEQKLDKSWFTQYQASPTEESEVSNIINVQVLLARGDQRKPDDDDSGWWRFAPGQDAVCKKVPALVIRVWDDGELEIQILTTKSKSKLPDLIKNSRLREYFQCMAHGVDSKERPTEGCAGIVRIAQVYRKYPWSVKPRFMHMSKTMRISGDSFRQKVGRVTNASSLNLIADTQVKAHQEAIDVVGGYFRALAERSRSRILRATSARTLTNNAITSRVSTLFHLLLPSPN